jgi:hypothetical protein
MPRRSGPRRNIFLDSVGELLSKPTATKQHLSLALTP